MPTPGFVAVLRPLLSEQPRSVRELAASSGLATETVGLVVEHLRERGELERDQTGGEPRYRVTSRPPAASGP